MKKLLYKLFGIETRVPRKPPISYLKLMVAVIDKYEIQRTQEFLGFCALVSFLQEKNHIPSLNWGDLFLKYINRTRPYSGSFFYNWRIGDWNARRAWLIKEIKNYYD